MEPTAVAGFAAVALTLIVVPGPDMAFVLAAGSAQRVVAPAAGGIALGYVGLTIVVAAGVGGLVATAPGALLALTVLGASYLTYLGIRTWRGAATTTIHEAGGQPGGRGSRRLLARGVGVSVLNPKGLLLFVAILPQFTSSRGWPLPLQLAALGLVFVLLTLVVYVPVGHAARTIVASRPGVAVATARVAAVAMVVVGAGLVAERLLAGH